MASISQSGTTIDTSAWPAHSSNSYARVNAVLVAALLALLLLAGIFAAKQAPRGDQFLPPSSLLTLEGWFAPIEINRFKRVVGPAIKSNLASIHFNADGKRGWAVGSGGTILATADGGKSWQAQASNSQASLQSVQFLADGLSGWAVGDKGTILTTADGGKTWQARALDSQVVSLQVATRNLDVDAQEHALSSPVSLQSVYFLADGLRGWAVGDGGPILATTDGGKTWQAQASASRAWLMSVHFLPEGLRGWAVGGGGTILATADGGKTWQAQASTSRAWLMSVNFLPDGLRGWAVGDQGTILATTDSGRTWQAQSLNSQAKLSSVHFLPDGLRGWAVGDQGTILATADSGRTWQTQSSNSQTKLSSVQFFDDGQRGWVVGNEGTILVTADGGKTWQIQSSNPKARLKSVQFFDDGLRGWAVGDQGTIIATADSGRTWQAQPSNSQALLSTVQFLDDGQRGWAAGDKGTILATVDGGKTWLKQISPFQYPIFSVHFLADGLRGRAVGLGGTILMTADGGKTWQVQVLNSGGIRTLYYRMQFLPDGLRGWAVEEHSLLATADGGKTWQRQGPNSRARLHSVHFLQDGLRGWAVGREGTILATTDGGKTWQAQASNSRAFLVSVQFLDDGLRGWVVGSEGEGNIILATVNGGKTWRIQALNPIVRLNSVHFLPDGLHSWAVEENGTILATNDGGKTWEDIAKYRRWPALWYWLLVAVTLAVLGWLTWRTHRRPKIDLDDCIAAIAVEDAPITEVHRDQLELAPIAEAIATFMRHERTRPPVTFAITAPWGRGKSSLMRLLQGRLRDEGIDTVWFNAWHHQKEPVILAALLKQIARQAIPPWLTAKGMGFRCELLRRRLLRQPYLGLGPLVIGSLGMLLLAPTALSLLVGLVAEPNPAHIDPFARDLAKLFQQVLQASLSNEATLKLLAGDWSGFLSGTLGAYGREPVKLLGPAVSIYLMVSLWLLVFHFLRPFPASPGALLASLTNRFSLRQAEEQTGFRERFREHFGDVCAALQPHTLTIFIDDLDRCDPNTAADMLEAINYLSSAGMCFIVLGIDKDIVEAQLGEVYKDMAARHAAFAQLNGHSDNCAVEPEKASQDMRTEHDRRHFARLYLGKLIQIEIPVPEFTPDALRLLLAEDLATDGDAAAARRRALRRQRLRQLLGWAGIWTKYALVLLVLFLGLNHGYRWLKQDGEQAVAAREKVIGQHQSLVEERRHAAHALADYREWAKQKLDTKPDTTLNDTDTSPQREERIRLREVAYRWTQLENSLVEMERQVRAKAKGAFKEADATVLGHLQVLARLKSEERMNVQGQKTEKPASPPNAPGNQNAEARRNEPPSGKEQTNGIIAPPDPAIAPSWPYETVIFLVFVLGIVLILRSFDKHRVKESLAYKHALAAWQPVLYSSERLRTPREARRFLNLSRYLTLRLNAAAYRRRHWTEDWKDWRKLRMPSPHPAEKTMNEAIIVGLTALHMVRPAKLDPIMGVAYYKVGLPPISRGSGKWNAELRKAIAKALQELDSNWQPSDANIKQFLDVVGEIKMQ